MNSYQQAIRDGGNRTVIEALFEARHGMVLDGHVKIAQVFATLELAKQAERIADAMERAERQP